MTLENNDNKLLTTKEVANMLNISVPSLRRLQNYEGGGPKFIRIGKAIRYKPSDIKKFIEEGSNEPV